jgi:hypothetical protein
VVRVDFNRLFHTYIEQQQCWRKRRRRRNNNDKRRRRRQEQEQRQQQHTDEELLLYDDDDDDSSAALLVNPITLEYNLDFCIEYFERLVDFSPSKNWWDRLSMMEEDFDNDDEDGGDQKIFGEDDDIDHSS